MSKSALKHTERNSRNAERSSADAVTKTLRVLERVASASGRLGVRELARDLGIGKSTTSRILQALERGGYVRFDESASAYVLGAKILHLAGQHYVNLELRKIARPFMREALEETGETVFLGMLDGGDVIILDRFDSPNPLRMMAELGTREPAHGTALGKVLLAFSDFTTDDMNPDELKGFTPNTITDPASLRQQLSTVRENGYAIDNEEHVEGVRCVAAPIRDSSGRTIAAISVSGPIFRLTDERIDMSREVVQRVAGSISWSLGHAESESPQQAAAPRAKRQTRNS